MKTFLRSLALVLLGATLAFGQPAKYPSSPIFILNQQGRPIPGAIASVTDFNGNPVTVWTDPNGANVFNGQVPASGLLQFFGGTGYYRVTVSGAGITYVYSTQCSPTNTGGGGGGGGDTDDAIHRVTIDRTADMWRQASDSATTFFCPTDGKPCTFAFAKAPDGGQYIAFDFVMPEYPLNPLGFLVSGYANTNHGFVTLSLDWCTYADGESPCTTTGAHSYNFTSGVGTPAGRRRDFVIQPSDWPTGWQPDDHVVVTLLRVYAANSDTLQTSWLFQNFRMEFSK